MSASITGIGNDGWETIATAPKDGSLVWLRDLNGGFVRVMAWSTKRKQWEGCEFCIGGPIRTYWDENHTKIYAWRSLTDEVKT